MDERSSGEPADPDVRHLMDERQARHEETKRLLDEMAARVARHEPVPVEMERQLQACLARLRDATRRLEDARGRRR